jgi:hypothetical protein
MINIVMADDMYMTTNFFHFGPPNNTLDYYQKRAQEYVDNMAKAEQKSVKLIAKFYPVRDLSKPDDPDKLFENQEFIGNYTAPTSSETKTVPNNVVDLAAEIKNQAQIKADESGTACTITATDNKGKDTVITVQPKPRPKELVDKATGTSTSTKPPDPDPRTLAVAESAAKEAIGSANSGDEQDNSVSPGMPKDQLAKVYNSSETTWWGYTNS